MASTYRDESDIFGNRTIRTVDQNRIHRHADFNVEEKECKKRIAELKEEVKHYKDIIEREATVNEKLFEDYRRRHTEIVVMKNRCDELRCSRPPWSSEEDSLRKALQEVTDANTRTGHEKQRIEFTIERLDDDLQSDAKQSEIYRGANNKRLRDIAHLQRRKAFFVDNMEARNEFNGKIQNRCGIVHTESADLKESERNSSEQLAADMEVKTFQCSQWIVEIGALDKEAKKLNDDANVASALYEKHQKNNEALKKKEKKLERGVADKIGRSIRLAAREEEKRKRAEEERRQRQSRWN